MIKDREKTISEKIIILVLVIILGCFGLFLIAYNSNSYVALGVFILLFTNNIEQFNRVKDEFKDRGL